MSTVLARSQCGMLIDRGSDLVANRSRPEEPVNQLKLTAQASCRTTAGACITALGACGSFVAVSSFLRGVSLYRRDVVEALDISSWS